jgi:hypothetical protein
MSDDGQGQVFFDEGDVTFFGKKGDYKVKKIPGFDFTGRRDGEITIQLSKKNLKADYLYEKEGPFLVLKYKEMGQVHFFTESKKFKDWKHPSGWVNEFNDDIPFPLPEALSFSGDREFMIRSVLKRDGNDSFFVKRLYFRGKGEEWSEFDYGEEELHSFEQVTGLYSHGDVVVTGLNGEKTFLSLDGGKNFNKISNHFPGLTSTERSVDDEALSKVRYVMAGDSLMAFVFHEKMLKIFKMDDLFSEGRGEWEFINTLDAGLKVSFDVQVINERLFLKFIDLYQSFDRGMTWQGMKGGPRNIELEGTFHQYKGRSYYFEKSEKKVYYWSQRMRKWKVANKKSFEALYTHETGIYGLEKGQIFRLQKFGGRVEKIGGEFLHPKFLSDIKLFVGHRKIFHFKKALLGIPLP